MKLHSDECQWTLLMRSQHWFRWWLGAVRQQAITWANVDSDLCRHMASLGHSEFWYEQFEVNLGPFLTNISGHVRTASANERRCYICNVFWHLICHNCFLISMRFFFYQIVNSYHTVTNLLTNVANVDTHAILNALHYISLNHWSDIHLLIYYIPIHNTMRNN